MLATEIVSCCLPILEPILLNHYFYNSLSSHLCLHIFFIFFSQSKYKAGRSLMKLKEFVFLFQFLIFFPMNSKIESFLLFWYARDRTIQFLDELEAHFFHLCTYYCTNNRHLVFLYFSEFELNRNFYWVFIDLKYYSVHPIW